MKNSIFTGFFETVKVVIAITAMCCILNNVSAQATLPFNSATQKVSYRFRVPVAAGSSKEQTFEALKGWVSNNASLFNRTNNYFDITAAANHNNKSFTDLEQTFSNVQPLQSIDPAGNRMAVRVMVKYQSNNGNRHIQLMCVQYYLVISVKDNAVEAEVTGIRYNHYNKQNFQTTRISSWNDYSSCEPTGTMEYLAENEHCHEEFVAFVIFFDKDVTNLQNQLGAFVVGSQALTLNK